MRKLLFAVLIAFIGFSPTFGSSVYYDLSLEPGVFDVQVIQSIKNPLPQFAHFQSSSTSTIVTDEYALDAREDRDLPAEVIAPKDRAIVRAGLQTASIAEDTAEIVMGALYTDETSLQYEGERLLFIRETNIHEITIVLPSEYAVIFTDQPSTIKMNDEGRVTLQILNPRGEMLKVRIVAHRVWGQQQDLSLSEMP